jgi:hypothetical protein
MSKMRELFFNPYISMEKAHQVLTNEQFEMIAKFFPKPRKPESITLRRCINAIFYVLKE